MSCKILLGNMNDVDRQEPLLFKRMLQNAAKSAQIIIVQYLIIQNPSFKIDREIGFAVAIGGSLEIYKALYTVDPNIVSLHFGHTGDPITVAIQSNNLPVLSYLLEMKADPNAGRYLSRWSPIALAASCSSEEVITLLVRYGAQVSQSNALQNAITADRRDLVRCLVTLSSDVNDTPEYLHVPKLSDRLETPLHAAVRAERLEMVRYFLNNGADPKFRDSEGKTVIQKAQEIRRADMVKALQYMVD